jgi:two-component system sensor histidine kinase/response regulator
MSEAEKSRDVTAQTAVAEQLRQQAELLQETQRRLDRASMSIQEGHWEVDMHTGRHWASTSYLALLGFPADSADCDTLEKALNLVHPDEREMVHIVTQRHFAGGPACDLEVRLRRAGGDYRWFRLRGSAEFDKDSRPVRMSGSINDIHKQRLAEEALREAQARFTRAIHGTQDGLWELDTVNRKLWLSPRLSELLGFADGELGDRVGALRARAYKEDFDAMKTAVRVAIEDCAPIDLEVRMQTKAGEYRWFRLRGTPGVNARGNVHRISGSMQDITEARLARDDLIRATEAAHAANRAKSEFLANVSHEIRTPMNGIIGMTRLLLDTSLDGTQRDFAETIRASADSLLSIINDLLDFSKIEAGRLDIESLEMDLPGNVEEVGSVMAFQAAAKNLELIVNVHPDVPRHVLGDPQRIRQCLINLIGNAIKFTRSGEIACEVNVGGRAAGRLRFTVRDTGIGIAPDALGSLFEPFVQADSSTTRHFGGTGLGLSIVRRLVQMMGGETGVESELGKGSTFWFELPMRPVASPAPETRTPLINTGRRILVVDDNGTNRCVLLTQLSHAGYEVTLASGGKEALATMRSATAAAARPFDVALVDFQMPDMDGAMLGEQINSDPYLSRTRVVLLTSMDRHGDMGRFAAMGFAGYLSKPVKPRELLATLEQVLSHDAEEWHTRTYPIITLNVAQQSALMKQFAGRVLLVEDNIVNQKVARRFLERLGCEVTVSENGLEAVRAFEGESFRLILMDVQMPFMDGLAASRKIRDLESSSQPSKARTPIVALTANAMQGQLERCLEAGMDALLTKPLNVQQLEEVLVRFGLNEPASAGRPPPVDLAGLNEMTGGDAGFAADLASSYLDNSRELYAQIRACLAKDRQQVARVAHQLAGASANVHAAPLRELCLNLENMAPTANTAQLEEALTKIGAELARVGAALRQGAAHALPDGLSDAAQPAS